MNSSDCVARELRQYYVRRGDLTSVLTTWTAVKRPCGYASNSIVNPERIGSNDPNALLWYLPVVPRWGGGLGYIEK